MDAPTVRGARISAQPDAADHLSRPEAGKYYAHAERPGQADRFWNCALVQTRPSQGYAGVRHDRLQLTRAVWQRADRRAIRRIRTGRAAPPAADRLRPDQLAVPPAPGQPDQPGPTTAAFGY